MTQAFVDSRGSLLANAAGVLGLAIRLRLDQLRVDLRHAIRGLMHQKTFTMTAVTTLALALGPATAVFSLINGVLLDPLPRARDLDRVVFTWAANPQQNRHEYPWSELNFVDHRARKQGLSALAAITGTTRRSAARFRNRSLARGCPRTFRVLVIARRWPPLPRGGHAAAGAPPTIILGHAYATKHSFAGSDPIVQTLISTGSRPR